MCSTAQRLNHGGDLCNRRYAESEVKISPHTVSKLKLKWEFIAGKDITATPAIFNGTVYFPSWNGNIYAVKADDGSLVWKKNLDELTGLKSPGFIFLINVTIARATPTVAGDLLIIGIYGPAVVIAVERTTGDLVWMTRLDSHNSSLITMSGTVHDGGFYVGTSSAEETLTVEQCCTFRSSLAKLDIQTGAILWQTFTLPDNFGERGEYAGAVIWGSSPSIDTKRNHVYIATGNLYSAPSHVTECQERENNQTVPTHPDQCIEPENHENSILAFDLDHGNIKWYRQLGGYDIWFFACSDLSNPLCPPAPNPDPDFGEAPMMLTIIVKGTNFAGPGGFAGGGSWGAATDGHEIYTNIINSDGLNFTLSPSKKTTNGGGWVAMHAYTGRILWSTANPTNLRASGPVDSEGALFAMDVDTGKILWTYNTGATIYGGVSVSNGCVYVGNGYKVSLGANIPTFTAGTSLYAFCIS
ncbi:hypothetical protein AQUCO_00200531v1 [Aquilegia coerulea]|uniref:Pyrrolo-quinoline quinone repeat domain-containing protein n=1 Tax=Aquilegia coerulea TaxID=218851 RepID=A0A2G5F3J5_AQUCA|nr:hypothetical protein AQUCO_00200531v1 [Aquilegia coerulea]